ncbi:long-chain fatty acid--CoA ligase [Prescottella subtropica]|uniref:long-chain fatty acid--CoA ligase n=1 Tax=Prescottella subtropica TaxID=2545757 RepID=UPI0010F697BD|nr:long-chain fatty acid--CoA ligase [Prescottella subtropica]
MSEKSSIGVGELTVRNILDHGARWHGNRCATTIQENRTATSVTYSELADRAGRLATALRALGIEPGDRVGSLLPNTQPHLDAYFAVPSMGAVLHTINVRLFEQQIVYTINHAQDRAIIVDPEYLGLLMPVLDQLETVRTLILTGPVDDDRLRSWTGAVHQYNDLLATHDNEGFGPPVDELSAATLCYTTGTTGDPKGIAYSHRSIWLHAMSLCTANAAALSSNDSCYIIVPMFHANAWGYPYATFWAGGDLVLSNKFVDPDSILWAVEEFNPTFANGVPTIWSDIARKFESSGSEAISSLHTIVVGGAPLPASLRRTYEQHGVRMLQGWGMTETSPLVSVNRPASTGNAELDPRYTSQGRVLAGVDLRVVDLESGQTLPNDGQSIGELELRGPWVADAYYGVHAPERFHDGWLRTGDIGTVDELGYITLTDRAKDVIKSGGEWISSVDLEAHLVGHDDVIEATVIGVPDTKWDERPCAVVVLRDGLTLDTEELRTYLAERVPRWWLPERWSHVEALPRTSVGKFDKKQLRQSYADGKLPVVHTGSTV